ncbi:MAG TPA: magnesium transporter CorA family protein [Spirochaetota bacterium]|nr:magnesium transporter CorA family protein [Spirochaetota bacterium]
MMEIQKNQNFTWIDIVNPTKNDMDYLVENYDFHSLDIEDCLSKVQRSKFEEYDDYKFIVLHFPVLTRKSYRLSIEEIDIFWGKNYLVTIHSNRFSKLLDLFILVKNNENYNNNYFSKGCDYLLYKIIHDMINMIFPIMNQISHEIDLIDSNLDTMKPQLIIERISALRRNIIFLQTSLKPQRAIFNIFENQLKDQEEKDMDIYWGDIGDYILKILETAEDYQELIEGLYSSIDTLLTFRTNDSIKTLTIFSVIMLPLTLITSFYGMNVALPLAENKIAAYIIFGSMIAISLAMIVYFKIKKI